MKELNDKIQSNKNLKSANENVLDSLRRKIANIKYQLKEEEEKKIPEPVDLAIFEEEINKLTPEIEAIENNVSSKPS